MPSKLPQWQRVALVAGILALAAALGVFVYGYVTRPVTLTVAVGSSDGEVVRRMSAIASGLATTGSNIRLKVIDTGTPVEEDIDAILKIEFSKHARGDATAADAGALNLAARRLEHLINHRRSVLTSTVAESSISKTPDRARFK